MIVRITRLLLLLQFLLAAGIAWVLVHTGRVGGAAPALALGIGIVVLVRLLIVTNNFYLSWRFGSRTPQACRLNWRQACRLYFTEFASSMLASSLTMPFRAFDKRIAARPVTLPVLLLHGYGCNSGYWDSMSKALVRAQITHYAVDMEPLMGSIDAYAAVVRQAVETVCRETGSDRVVIVAHSMGGLAARVYLRDYGPNRIAKVITLGTPHRGTGVAQFGIGQNCREMHWLPDAGEGRPSEWLRTLAADEDSRVYPLFVSIYSHHDNIVAPQTSSHLPGACNMELCGIGHVALAFDSRVQTIVIDEIRKASQCTTATARLETNR